ncbi:MAG: MFS transporter [Thermogutta sp.]
MDQNEGHSRNLEEVGQPLDRTARGSAISPSEARTFWLLVFHQIMFRVGWTFKTESVVLPSFLDYLAGPGAGVFRGFLPVLSRLGQGILPLAASSTIEASQHKRALLALITLLLAIPLTAFALIAIANEGLQWHVGVVTFLVMYFVFSAMYGIYQVVFNTVQGKLIKPEKRGRLMAYSTFWGTFPAILAALFLLRSWLCSNNAQYDVVFFAGALLFALSGVLCLFLQEVREESPEKNSAARTAVNTISSLRCHPNLRGLWLVITLFSFSLTLIPHYQAFARFQLHIGSEQLFLWVIAQSASVGVFSLLIGGLADRWGNRLTLAILLFGSVLAPGWSLILFYFPQFAKPSVWLTFVALAFSTLVPRVAANYALELVPPEDHPVATALLQFGMTLPLFASPIFGYLIERWGFETPLSGAIVVDLLATAITFVLPEPRHRLALGEHVSKPIAAAE